MYKSLPSFVEVSCTVFMDIQGITKILMSCCYVQVVVTKYVKSSAKSFLQENSIIPIKDYEVQKKIYAMVIKTVSSNVDN